MIRPSTTDRIYLSGSMSSWDEAVEAFAYTQKRLTESGYENVFNPASVLYTDQRFIGKPAQGFREQITELAQADSVVFFGSWQTQRGCITELFNAVMFGCSLFTLSPGNDSPQFQTVTVDRSNVNSTVSGLLKAQQRKFDSEVHL
jgi:hypothetical protein